MLLRELQIDTKSSNLIKFKSALYIKSGSMLLVDKTKGLEKEGPAFNHVIARTSLCKHPSIF